MNRSFNIEEFQEKMFGRNYVGACLANIIVPPDQAEKMSKWINDPRDFLVVLGHPGAGKTYICAAMMELIQKKFMTFRVWNEKQLLSRVRQTIGEENSMDCSKAMEYFVDDEFVIIDDIGSTGYTAWREEMLMGLVDYRYSSNKPTVISSNLSIKDFYRAYDRRICSRLFAGRNTIIDLEGGIDHRAEGR